MGKFLRKKEILEYMVICLCVFLSSILVNYLPKIEIHNGLLYSFIMGYNDFKHEISIALTFFALLFQYIIVIRKKKEIYIRIIIGDTISNIRKFFLIECIIITSVLFLIAITISSFLRLEIIDCIVVYILFNIWTYLSALFLRF